MTSAACKQEAANERPEFVLHDCLMFLFPAANRRRMPAMGARMSEKLIMEN
jgi:hypothetical protein